MAVHKSEIYSLLYEMCDNLRGSKNIGERFDTEGDALETAVKGHLAEMGC